MRTCGFPGCNVSIEGRHKCTRWCIEHSLAIQKSRKSRKEAYGGRKSVRSRTNVIKHTIFAEPPRRPDIKCKLCGGMPWARCCERSDDRHYALEPVAYPPGRGVPGWHVPVCRMCGLAYAEEPESKRGSLIVSSMARALVET